MAVAAVELAGGEDERGEEEHSQRRGDFGRPKEAVDDKEKGSDEGWIQDPQQAVEILAMKAEGTTWNEGKAQLAVILWG